MSFLTISNISAFEGWYFLLRPKDSPLLWVFALSFEFSLLDYMEEFFDLSTDDDFLAELAVR